MRSSLGDDGATQRNATPISLGLQPAAAITETTHHASEQDQGTGDMLAAFTGMVDGDSCKHASETSTWLRAVGAYRLWENTRNQFDLHRDDARRSSSAMPGCRGARAAEASLTRTAPTAILARSSGAAAWELTAPAVAAVWEAGELDPRSVLRRGKGRPSHLTMCWLWDFGLPRNSQLPARQVRHVSRWLVASNVAPRLVELRVEGRQTYGRCHALRRSLAVAP